MSCNYIQIPQGNLRQRLRGIIGEPTLKSQVRYLMHFDGTMSDAAQGHNVTRQNTSFHNSAYRFGTASLDVSGTSGNKVILNPKPDDMIGESDFTIEMWCNQYGARLAGLFQIYDSTVFNPNAEPNGLQLFMTSNDKSFTLTNGRDTLFTTAINQVPVPGWTHMAITRQDDTVSLWIGGKLAGRTTVDKWDITASLWHLGWVARSTPSGDSWINYIDEFRVCLGVCVYTAPFTPPTAAFSLPRN